MKKISFLFSVFTLLATSANAQLKGQNPLKVYEVKAYTTDPAISKESGTHLCYTNTDVTSRKTLVLHLIDNTESTKSIQYFPKMAANNGFNVIVLDYKNDIAANKACKNSDDPNVFENFRKEIIEGRDYSAFVNVDSVNSINNRVIKLLKYLHKTHPKEGWNIFFTGNVINWTNIIVSGHSQGGGTAAVIAQYNRVKRVLLFAAPSDYSDYYKKHAKWTYRAHITPASDYYAFSALYDRQVDFSIQYQQWINLGLKEFGDTLSVDRKTYLEKNSHMLYTKQSVFGMVGNHAIMIVDRFLFLDEEKVPVFESCWKKMLGIL
jgi:hypothetical protein